MKLNIWTSHILMVLVLLCCCLVSLPTHLAHADDFVGIDGHLIISLQNDLETAEGNIETIGFQLAAAHDAMDTLYAEWNAQSASNRDKKVDALLSVMSLDWGSLVKQGAKIGITFDPEKSLTDNFDLAISKVQALIVGMKAAIVRYYAILSNLQSLISAHNAGHPDRGFTPWERHPLPTGSTKFVDDDLPDISCYGGCGATFSSPSAAESDHRTKCGDGENVDDEATRERLSNGGNHTNIVQVLLSNRPITAGCGRDYYWCTESEDHGIRYCEEPNCNEPFRRCMPQSLHGGSSHNRIEADTPTPYQASATVPDRPGSFSLSPNNISIRLYWTDSPSDGGSDITAYEYQVRGATGFSSWGSWSSWTSGGTDNFALITGLSRNTKYAVRMRAVNEVGPSSVTGINITWTNE